MLKIVLPYCTGNLETDFLLTKQEVIHLLHYRLAFYLHIFPSLLVLAAGVIQFSTEILRTRKRVHRFAGKIYAFIVLFISAPAALVMSFYAIGGIFSISGFIILSLLWWYFTARGFWAAVNKRIEEHKNFMIRSYALTLSAISLRAYQFFIPDFFNFSPMTAYVFLSWVSWVGNLLVAEVWIRKRQYLS